MENPEISDKNNSSNKKDIIDSQKNGKNEIEILKKEINDLKAQHQQDQKNISELKALFQTEIKKLNEKIKSLSKEIKSLKLNQKVDDNNINNINNVDNDEDNEEIIENKDNKYSLECLSRKLSIDIIQGTERTNLDIAVMNNSKLKFPENSLLVCDTKKSLLLCDDADLSQLEPSEQKIVNIQFKNLKYISKGNYKCIIVLMIENKVYKSSSIELTINVVAPIINENNQQNSNNNINNFGINNNLNINNNINNYNNLNSNPFLNNDDNNGVSRFREQFSLFDYENIPDERIMNALLLNNNDFNKAFASLFE